MKAKTIWATILVLGVTAVAGAVPDQPFMQPARICKLRRPNCSEPLPIRVVIASTPSV